MSPSTSSLIQPLLEDVVVVELRGSTAGAYAANLFAEAGARVARVHPGGVGSLAADPAVEAAWGAERLQLQEGSAEADTWLSIADILIESDQFGPVQTGVLRALAPGAVRVRISPFGSSGPYATWRSADIVDQAIGGHLYLSGDPSREPLQGPVGQAALAAGVLAAIGAMAALHTRRAGGSDDAVDVTHHEVLAALHQFTDVRYTHAGDLLARMGNRYAGPGSPIGMYRAADGWIAVTVSTIQHATTLLAVTGLEHLLERPDVESIIDVMVNPAILDPAFNEWLAGWKVLDAVEYLQSARLAAAPVLTMGQLLRDGHLAERGWWRQIEVDGRWVKAPGSPFRVQPAVASNASPPSPPSPPAPSPPSPPAPSPPSPPAPSPPSPPAPSLSSPPSSPGIPGPSPRPAGPLAGLRVLDLTRVWAGPLAARILADLGADVVMVEAPWGRGGTDVPASYVQASHFFPADEPGLNSWNRNGFINKFALGKRSLAIDIVDPAGRSAFERLVGSADVLIENFSPRVMPNLGLDADRLHELNPALLYVTMPGYGRTGPARDYSAYGPVLDSHAGLSTLMGYPDCDAWKCGIAWPDPVAGIHTAFAVIAALWLHRRGPAPTGATIEVAQIETAVGMIADHLIRTQLQGADPPILGNRHAASAPQGVYRCAGDDRWVALTVPDDMTWFSVCNTAGLPGDWVSWDEAARRAAHDRIDAAITAWTSSRSPADAAHVLQSVGVPAAPVANAADLLNDPQLAERGFFSEVTHPDAGTHRWAGLPVELSGSPTPPRGPAPGLGQHNREVLRAWAGVKDDEVERLERSGVLATRPPG